MYEVQDALTRLSAGVVRGPPSPGHVLLPVMLAKLEYAWNSGSLQCPDKEALQHQSEHIREGELLCHQIGVSGRRHQKDFPGNMTRMDAEDHQNDRFYQGFRKSLKDTFMRLEPNMARS